MDVPDLGLRSQLPKHKRDLQAARAIVTRGFPAVAPVLPELLEWLQDCNWPVAHVLAPFLATIGLPLLPDIRQVLQTDDNQWKYWVLGEVVGQCPELAVALRDELTRLATAPTPLEVSDELHLVAQEILDRVSHEPGQIG